MAKYVPPAKRGLLAEQGVYRAAASTSTSAGADGVEKKEAAVNYKLTPEVENKLQKPAWRAPTNVYDQRWNPEVVKPKTDERPSGTLIKILTTGMDLGHHSGVSITNCEFLASFSKIRDQDTPTIVIPGVPPAWIGAPQDRVSWDDRSDRDDLPSSNTPNSPIFSMQPTMQAILSMSVGNKGEDIDLVTSDNILVSLLKYVEGAEWSFRFDVELLGKTALLQRTGPKLSQLFREVIGYNFQFTKASTKLPNGFHGATSHWRIIRYDLGGLRVVVYSNTNGFIPDGQTSSLSSTPIDTTEMNDGLTTKRGGMIVPQSSLLEVKTRSNRHGKEPNRSDVCRKLCMKQTFNYVIGIHDRGKFEDVKIHNMKDEVTKWEADNEVNLGRLRDIIREIIDTSIKHGKGGVEVVRVDNGPLKICERVGEEQEMLPTSLKTRWTAGGDQ